MLWDSAVGRCMQDRSCLFLGCLVPGTGWRQYERLERMAYAVQRT